MNNEDIERLATGGLLHDIGKRQIPDLYFAPGKFDKRRGAYSAASNSGISRTHATGKN